MERLRQPEIRPRVRLTEHMFPGVKWEDVPRQNLLHTPQFTAFVLGMLEAAKYYGEAAQAGQRFTVRMELPRFDRLSLAYMLWKTEPVFGGFAERIKREVEEQPVLKPGEILGGVGKKRIWWPKYSDNSSHLQMARSFFAGDDMYHRIQLSALGVLGRDNQPRAVLWHHAGEGISMDKPAQSSKPVFFGLQSKLAHKGL